MPRGDAPALNTEALACFFRAGCIPAPLSIYSGVHQLPPGHCLAFGSPHQHSAPRPWWNLHEQASQAFARQPLGATPPEADVLDQLEQTLQQVIAEQALADVPLGTFLSGGVDSSLITALMQAAAAGLSVVSQSPSPTKAAEAGFNEAPCRCGGGTSASSHRSCTHCRGRHALIPSCPCSTANPSPILRSCHPSGLP